jgi:hypothetical protein
MLTQTLHKNTPLHVLDPMRITMVLLGLTPEFLDCTKDKNILQLNFKSQKIILPLTTTITWGQLTDSLKEKGLIP